MCKFSKIDRKIFGSLPASAVADEVNARLQESARLVVTAAPGAGKSTLLPLTILDSLGADGKILMLEPRRIAARQIAERMAFMLGEKVGRTVGYRVRFENCVSAGTRIEVLTEGILTRMISADPTLEGVSVLIFDEFHERSLASDVALALARETQDLVRPDLRIVIMSATIDAGSICRGLAAPLVSSEGRCFPVEVIHADECRPEDAAQATAHWIRKAHTAHEGDILAFLPVEADIRRCFEILGEALSPTRIYPLYGMLPFEDQRRAIAPSAPGERKVVLATPIAETSLTIEGVRVVVDSGFCRKMVYDDQNGLSHLETVRISMDMATQRSGRAGRVAPGVCYRLWSVATEQRMAGCRVPEILEADLAPMVLDIASWGEGSVEGLKWLTSPPAYKISQARGLLAMLGALDDGGSLTPLGRKIAALPCHPRIANMLATAESPESLALAADVAALLEEKDPMPELQGDSDLGTRLRELRRLRAGGHLPRQWQRIDRIAEQYRSLARLRDCQHLDAEADSFEIGALLASAYPEKVAKASDDGCGRFLLSGGGQAFVDADDVLASCGWLAVASLNARKDGPGRIHLAAPLDPADLKSVRERDNVGWDSRQGRVVARHEKNIGCLSIESRPLQNIPHDEVVRVMCEAARKDGLSMFDFSDEVANLQRRISAVSAWRPELGLPDVTTEALLAAASEWLPLYVGNASSSAELHKMDLCKAIWAMLDYSQQQAVDRLAPSHIAVPTGSRIRVEYRLGADAPVLRVRLQECFGLLDTPRVDDGRRPVLMELLSPGFKPVQLTSDLRSFWEGTYFEVRKELKRRYPKHAWPDNPLDAEAVRGVRGR